MSELTYQIDQNGVVTILAGGQRYTLVTEQSTELPWTNSKQSRWDVLRQAVTKQPPGIWVIYSGFPSESELQRATGVVGKIKGMERSANKAELKLAVKRSA